MFSIRGWVDEKMAGGKNSGPDGVFFVSGGCEPRFLSERFGNNGRLGQEERDQRVGLGAVSGRNEGTGAMIQRFHTMTGRSGLAKFESPTQRPESKSRAASNCALPLGSSGRKPRRRQANNLLECPLDGADDDNGGERCVMDGSM